MSWGSSSGAARERDTSMDCLNCGAKVTVRRSCLSVSLHCKSCGANFPAEKYIHCMDDAMESFMENVYCNRI